MTNDPEVFQQDTGQAAAAADVIEKSAKKIGVDGESGHVGDMKRLLNDLAREWHSQASVEHRERMDKWNAMVVKLATLTNQIGIQLRGGTEELDGATRTLQSPSNRFAQGLNPPT